MSAAAASSSTTTVKKARPNLRPWPTNGEKGPQPHPLPEMTDVEKNAARKLLEAGYLLYCEVDRVCPFKDLLDVADSNWDKYPGCTDRPGKLSLTSTHAEEKELANKIEHLKTELLQDVGGDVIAGTIFAINAPDAQGEKRYDRFRSEFEKSVHDRDFDPGSSFAPDELATTSFTIKTDKAEFTFPLKEADSKGLIFDGMFSEFGIEGQGNHRDEGVRMSREYVVPLDKKANKTQQEIVKKKQEKKYENDDDQEDINEQQKETKTNESGGDDKELPPHNQHGVDPDCPRVYLPPWLHHPRHFFPKLEKVIRERLAPNAGEIAIVPYKLVCYSSGDFFEQHRDSCNDPRHFGTLSIDLPMEGSYSDSSPFPFDPEYYEYDDEGEKRDRTEREEEFGDKEPDERRAAGSALRFFLGRGGKTPSLSGECEENAAVRNFFDNDYGRQADCTSQLACQVFFQNYTQEELEGKYSPISASASRLAEPHRRIDGTPITEVEYIRWKKLESVLDDDDGNATAKTKSHSRSRNRDPWPCDARPPIKGFSQNGRRHTPLKFAAWLTDVHHDVRKVVGKDAARIVMTYKLFKRRITALSIPREKLLAKEIAGIRDLFSKYLETRKGGLYQSPNPRTIGFILRHCYPVASLAEPWNCLKSVDAIVHQLFSNQCECLLAPVILVKDNDVGVPYRDDPASKRCVYLTGGPIPPFVREKLGHEDPRGTVHLWFPQIIPIQWVELGFGELIERGSSLGNGDCGARYAYFTSAMICFLDNPSHWKRRRVAFLIQEKGYEGNMFQKIGEYYPIFRNVVWFL